MAPTAWERLEAGSSAILQRLLAAGFEAYRVGGCVRDRLLGRPVKDIDIATNARPEEVSGLFAHTIPTGLAHGTITVLQDGRPYEVTTYREEAAYLDHRRPSQVTFIPDLERDLARRDFTMNAMAMDLDGRVIDPFGGREDLRLKRIRCVGNPSERFGEDALRLLRCVRFAAEYELRVEDETWAALLRQGPTLRAVAMERVHAELERMVNGSHPAAAFRLLAESGLPAYFRAGAADPAVWRTAASKPGLHAAGAVRPGTERWAGWFLLLEYAPHEARAAMTAWKFPNALKSAVLRVLSFHEAMAGPADESEQAAGQAEARFKDAVLAFGSQAAEAWLSLAEAMSKTADVAAEATQAAEALRAGSSGRPALAARHGRRWLAGMAAADLADLALDGQALLKLGWRPGPAIGRSLRELLRMAAHGEVANEPEALREAAMRLRSREEMRLVDGD